MNHYERVVANIDLSAIRTNINNLKNHTAPGTLICGVVKTDGYGHGAVPIAQYCGKLFDWFAVATIEEALDLRLHGITHPIVILGFVPKSHYADLANEEIRPNVYDYAQAQEMSRAAVLCARTIKVHIKIDTGMNRLGFLCTQESVEEIVKISSLPGICIEGIFTHFVSSDETDKTFAKEQETRFRTMIEKLEERGVSIPIHHISNSAGMIDLPEANADMVRAGIAMYGLYPSDEVQKENVKLLPALSLTSQVVHLKTIPAGVGISYGATCVTKRETRVATIPVGYGDGYPRTLSNCGYVLIHGQKAPILGRICMDQFMVDVTDIAGVENGTPVTLIGTDGGEMISVETLMELCGGFHYEFICNLGKRVPRRYLADGKVIEEKDYFIT